MPLRKRTILVIDDTASIRTFLRISLSAYGAIVHEAETAKEGIEKFKSILPDLVILDLGLPDKDGLEILPEIRSYAETKAHTCRIVILSVRKEQKAIDAAMEAGASAYLPKPFLMENLIDVLHVQRT